MSLSTNVAVSYIYLVKLQTSLMLGFTHKMLCWCSIGYGSVSVWVCYEFIDYPYWLLTFLLDIQNCCVIAGASMVVASAGDRSIGQICLLVSSFDLVAVLLVDIRERWKFYYMLILFKILCYTWTKVSCISV